MKRMWFLIVLFLCSSTFAQQPGKPLPPWQEGMLDLHHVTNVAFFEVEIAQCAE